MKISLLLPTWSWTALALSELCCSTHWMGKHSWGTNKPYLQAPLSALLSRKVRCIQRGGDKQISCNTRHICFPEHAVWKHRLSKKRAIHHTLRLHDDINQSRRTAAAASASVWTSNCCECSTQSSVAKIKTQCCLRKHKENQYVRALKSSPQSSATKWKYMGKKPLIASVNHMLSWKSLSMVRTCILSHCKETAFCSKQWITLLAAVLQEPKAALATPTEV